MSTVEDRTFIMNYMVQKEIQKARERGVILDSPEDAYKLLDGYMELIGEELEKNKDEADLSSIQQKLIKVASLSILFSIDACTV